MPETPAFELGTDGPTAILVGIDDTVTASRAAFYAAGLARRQGARLIAVFVSPTTTKAAVSPSGAAVVEAENEAHEAIRNWMATNRRESAGQSWEIYGDPTPDPATTETTVVYLLK